MLIDVIEKPMDKVQINIANIKNQSPRKQSLVFITFRGSVRTSGLWACLGETRDR